MKAYPVIFRQYLSGIYTWKTTKPKISQTFSQLLSKDYRDGNTETKYEKMGVFGWYNNSFL